MDRWTRVVLREKNLTFMNSRSELTSVAQHTHDTVVSSQLHKLYNYSLGCNYKLVGMGDSYAMLKNMGGFDLNYQCCEKCFYNKYSLLPRPFPLYAVYVVCMRCERLGDEVALTC